MDDAEEELQLLLSLIGAILFLQVPVFFVTWLSFPDLGILQRFFKMQMTLDSELLVKLKQVTSSLNIQNSNVKVDTYHRGHVIPKNFSLFSDEPVKTFDDLQRVHAFPRDHGSLLNLCNSNDRLKADASHLRIWLWDNRFIPQFHDISNFEDYVKMSSKKDITNRRNMTSLCRVKFL